MAERGGARGRGVFVAGGAALIALGVWLGGLFNGFGLGPGTGDGDGKGTASNPEKKDDRTAIVDPDEGARNDGPLHVVLVPSGYAIAVERDGKRTFSNATIREVLADAAAAKPGGDGYRVVITTRAGVSIGAHEDLVRQLETAGLKPDEILGYDSKDVAAEE